MTSKTLLSHVASSSKKIFSTGNVNRRPILNAKGKLGSNLPFSIALAVCLDTSKALAKSAWASLVQPEVLLAGFSFVSPVAD